MSNLPQIIQSQFPTLSQETAERWVALQKQGLFEIEKAIQAESLLKQDFTHFLVVDSKTAINSTASLATTKKYLGEDARDYILENSLMLVNELVPDKNKITPIMIKLLIRKLTLEFHHLKISEIIHALSKGLSGDYGKVTWGAIGVSDMTDWINTYNNQRNFDLEKANIEKASQYKATEREAQWDIEKVKELRLKIEALPQLKENRNGWGQRTKEKLSTNETERQIP